MGSFYINVFELIKYINRLLFCLKFKLAETFNCPRQDPGPAKISIAFRLV